MQALLGPGVEHVVDLPATQAWPERVERIIPSFDCRVLNVPSRVEAVKRSDIGQKAFGATYTAIVDASARPITQTEMLNAASPRNKSMA
jgi:hypothetical protein